MRYQNLGSFQKHLKAASPGHLCRCYLVAVPDDYDRAKIVLSIRSHLPVSGAVVLRGSETSFRALSDALLNPSLFASQPVVCLDEAEKMEKGDLQALSGFVINESFDGYLLCASRSKTLLAGAFERAGVVLDLIEEKPWDCSQRIAEQLSERASQSGKRLDSDTVSLLFERLGFDAALLDGELDKLICYVGEKPVIERSDVCRIVGANRAYNVWQIAEDIVWGENALPFEAASLHALLPVIRSQLEIGRKMTDLIAANVPREEWNTHLPKLWPKTLEKRSAQAAKFGCSYFQKGLDLLFEIELLSRTESAREAACLDLFRCSLAR